MLNSFSIILASYGVRVDRSNTSNAVPETSKPKKAEKYGYFVGKGNNKNLIISLFKKRWWWTEADDMSSAHFVWTQIKAQSILQKQASMQYSDLE